MARVRLTAASVPAVLAVTWLAAAASAAAAQPLPSSSLSVRAENGWEEIWRAEDAPTRWSAADPRMSRAIRWKDAGPGVERAEVSIAGERATLRFRLILVRIDPRRIELKLEEALREGGTLGAWTVDSAPADALLAVNAGQFHGGRPWGWLVREGREYQPPGTGSLGMAVVVDSAGTVRLLPPDGIALARAGGGIVAAFQSYPMLLADGTVPEPLRAAGAGVNLSHRDSRVALGQLPDGRVLLAVTRYEGLGGVLSSLPVGPTSPEMAAIMGALGCISAVSLDGGLSAQLLLRDPAGRTVRWPGMRRVPLGLVARPR